MNFDSSTAIRAGLIGAAAGFVVAVLGRVPFLGCIIAPLGWLVAVGTGVLYVYFATESGRSVELAEGAVGGGVAGLIGGGANAFVSGILNLIFGATQSAASLLGGEIGQAAAQAGIGLVSVIVGIIVGIIVGAILGAIGGGVFAAIKQP
jgi:hypothetical protein